MRHPLDGLVETIEFTLISVIQGVALYFFINDAKDIILRLEYEYWVYVAVSFVLLNLFWSQALVHVMSFISWPFEFIHTFLYFLIVSMEVLLFENMADPAGWFFWNMFFFIAAGLLYYADLVLLQSKKPRFETSESGRAFYGSLLRQQRIGLYGLVPAGILISYLAWRALSSDRAIIIGAHGHLVLGILQLIVTVGVLGWVLRSFRQHFAYIEAMKAG